MAKTVERVRDEYAAQVELARQLECGLRAARKLCRMRTKCTKTDEMPIKCPALWFCSTYLAEGGDFPSDFDFGAEANE